MYEFRPFAVEATTLRLGARRLGRLDMREVTGVQTLVPEEGVAYIEFARPLRPSVTQGSMYIKIGTLLVTPALKLHK